MEDDGQNNQKCKICGNTDFFIEDGYYFCQTCQTQIEDKREEVFEVRIDANTRLRKTKIKQSKCKRKADDLGWTSWELYNFILIGLTNELIELGVTPDIKLTILQLWATYLRKIDVAFVSTVKKCVPKLARKYKRRDAEIIYGKICTQRKAKKQRKGSNGTSASTISDYTSEGNSTRDLNRSKKLMVTAEYDKYVQSQENSDGDGVSLFSQSLYSVYSGSVKSESASTIRFASHAKQEAKKISSMSKKLPVYKRTKYREKYVTTQYKTGPQVITVMKLWAIIYMALRIHNETIQLSDMLRYAREGHLSYYRLDHLIPAEVTLTKEDMNFLSQYSEITHKGMRRTIASMARFIGVKEFVCPNFQLLVNRYCQELELPRGISLYSERLIAVFPPKMRFEPKQPYIPNYEARAMAFIIVVMKVLLGLDGITEYAISETADQINNVGCARNLLESKLYSFYEWQRYIECRKTVLVNLHFPTQTKYNPNAPGNDDKYIKFLERISNKKDKEETQQINSSNLIPRDLAQMMEQCIDSLNENSVPIDEVEIFPPSLTPFYSNLRQLLGYSCYDIPSILRINFYDAKVGYMTRPKMLKELAAQCHINLEIIDSNLHFVEKFVPHFEQVRIANITDLKQNVEILDTDSTAESSVKMEYYADCVNKTMLSNININDTKRSYFDDFYRSSKDTRNVEVENDCDFIFNDVSSNGKLIIPGYTNYEKEADELQCTPISNEKSNLLKIISHDKYNLELLRSEKESILKSQTTECNNFIYKTKPKIVRDSIGKFVTNDSCAIKKEKKKREKIAGKINGVQSQEVVELGTNKTDKTSAGSVEYLSQKTRSNESSHEEISCYENVTNLSDYFNLSDISILDETSIQGKNDIDERNSSNADKILSNEANYKSLKFFRPYKDYWMYHCIFSKVKQKNFESLEKMLPKSFRWLLNECANIVEMTTEDLYEEICLVETFYMHVLRYDDSKKSVRRNSSTLRGRVNRNKW